MLSMERWHGKVALVSGASSGMGEAIAERLAQSGLRVVITARRAALLNQLQTRIAGSGGTAMAVPTDLRDEGSIQNLFDTIRKEWDGVDVLINNAGLGHEHTIAGGNMDHWREMVDVNVLALTLCMREAVLDMARKGGGQIINVSSSTAHGIPPGKNLTFYAATKYAVRAVTDGMRDELLQKNSLIKIGMVTPGLTQTGFHERFFRDDAKAKQYYSHFKPLEPEDVADAVCYMLSTPPHVQVNDLIFRPLGQAD